MSGKTEIRNRLKARIATTHAAEAEAKSHVRQLTSTEQSLFETLCGSENRVRFKCVQCCEYYCDKCKDSHLQCDEPLANVTINKVCDCEPSPTVFECKKCNRRYCKQCVIINNRCLCEPIPIMSIECPGELTADGKCKAGCHPMGAVENGKHKTYTSCYFLQWEYDKFQRDPTCTNQHPDNKCCFNRVYPLTRFASLNEIKKGKVIPPPGFKVAC